MNHRLKSQAGFALMPFSLIMGVLMAMIFLYASQKSEDLIKRYSVTQANSYALDLGAKIAQRARWSYDIAKADAGPTAPNLCVGTYGGVLTPVGAFQMCLIDGKICVQHPRSSSKKVCVSPADGTLLAKELDPLKNSRTPSRNAIAAFSRIWIETANAASIFSPAPPSAAETSNSLGAAPTCLGGPCAVTCALNADCVSFKFCPLLSDCNSDEFMWQTVGFLKGP